MKDAERRGTRDVEAISAEMHKGSRLALPVVDRTAFLVELSRGARLVAHIGCADSPFTRERLSTGSLLHCELVDVSQCEGFDVDEKGINTLRAAMPSETFHCVDISRDLSEVFRGRYDLVIAGEVLEHVPNAGHFLAGCRALLAPEGKLCVTVPNAVAPKNGARAAGGYEVTHPDHFVYYSPRTVARTLRAAGFVPTAITTYFADADPSGRIFNAAVRAIQRLRRGPVGDGVIALATPKIGDDIDG